MFFKGSRYENVKTLEWENEDGSVFQYKATRYIPDTVARLAHKVQGGERLDNISYRYLRDPERYWRICDTNEVLWPDDLTADSDTIIRIPASEG